MNSIGFRAYYFVLTKCCKNVVKFGKAGNRADKFPGQISPESLRAASAANANPAYKPGQLRR